jgi:hypothetical protein
LTEENRFPSLLPLLESAASILKLFGKSKRFFEAMLELYAADEMMISEREIEIQAVVDLRHGIDLL